LPFRNNFPSLEARAQQIWISNWENQMSPTQSVEAVRQSEWVELYRKQHPIADCWAVGYEQINHNPETQARIFSMAQRLIQEGKVKDEEHFFNLLCNLDRVTSAGMWLAVHQVYTRNVYLDGRDLDADDFKAKPEGHTGGSLNMVPAYMGYMGINAITGFTRSWIMGQGHCVSAIDSVNLLLDNLNPAHGERYSLSDEGLTRYVRDFYSYKLDEHGEQDSPLGSHVNAHTAGGLAEGGYLGFVQLQYMHMPLPGESLVTFLSDGAFEEQRGSDWAPRWWRAKDCGLPLPIMINNGRRIDQRSTMAQKGGTSWFVEHLKLNHFDPIVIDGKDPAAFVWLIYEMESRLTAAAKAIEMGQEQYPVRLPYGIAVAPKGAGFYNAGVNLAHNLPLGANPSKDVQAAKIFNEHARKLWVPEAELKDAVSKLQNHGETDRPKECNHPVTWRDINLREVPTPEFEPIPETRLERSTWTKTLPMKAVDSMFLATVRANSHLRPRVGNPDEMRSNRLQTTLDALKFRVTEPEPGIPEELDGAVITALNEEAVASAALANKGGINLIATYEAFGAKMHGVMRQEIIFAKHNKAVGQVGKWLSIPLVLTSHTWENGKNEQSHQDPVMAEAMLGEASDVSRVMFAADYNTAAVLMQNVYQTYGQYWTLVVSKRSIANLFTPEEAARLVEQGALRIDWSSHSVDQQRVILTAIGAYQFEAVLKASDRLRERDIPHSVVYMLEPGRFRLPRDQGEVAHVAPAQVCAELYPESVPARVFVTHTRPEPIVGTLQPLFTGRDHTAALGYVNQGGTLDASGMLFINRSTWGHILLETARVLEIQQEDLLTPEELDALHGRACPEGVIV
jgi:phosphoketolase